MGAVVSRNSRLFRFGIPSIALLGMLAIVPIAQAATPSHPSGPWVRTNATAQARTAGQVNTKLAFDERSMRSRSVRADNSALANTTCDDCRTVALSVQVVMVSGASVDITANNRAEAVNQNCSDCESLALAYQFLVKTRNPLELPKATRDRLEQIEMALGQLRTSESGIADIKAAVDVYVGEVLTLVQTAAQNQPAVSDTHGRAQPKVSVQRHEQAHPRGTAGTIRRR